MCLEMRIEAVVVAAVVSVEFVEMRRQVVALHWEHPACLHPVLAYPS